MVSSFFLRSAPFALPLLLAQPALAQTSSTYQLDTEYTGSSFFDGWDFYSGADPTNGFVTYLNESTALSRSLISSGDGSPAIMSVDSTTTLATDGSQGGRSSVRIASQKTWTHGLFIGDFNHMPGGICGTWPAFWTLGSDWPSHGEIDIVEGVNSASTNLMSLHSSPNCTIAGANELGTLQTNNCDTAANYNSGCGVTADTTSSYGTGFNSVGGGVYAMQWTSDYIRIWFFERSSIPSDISAGTPNPSNWGEPQANMQGSCSIDEHFAGHQIIFDTTFCGDYGNALWSSDSTCSALSSSCNAYVAQNPSAFTNAYWSVNSLRVYQLAASNSTAPTSSTSSTSLSSVTAASSVLGPGMGNTTSVPTSTSGASLLSGFSASSTAPYSEASATGNPTVIDGYHYLGCYGSTSNFTSFNIVGSADNMSNDVCVSLCSGSQYVGTYQNNCYCGSTLDNSTTSRGSGQCSLPCPGSSTETCGGNAVAGLSRFRRAVPDTFLLSIYSIIVSTGNPQSSIVSVINAASVNVQASVETSASTISDLAIGVSGPATTAATISNFIIGGNPAAAAAAATAPAVNGITPAHYLGSGTPTGPLTSVSPASQTIGYGMGVGSGSDGYATVYTTTYVDVCPTGLATYTMTTTIAECGCTRTAGALTTTTGPATVTMTTTVKECTACAATGGPASVTVTVPLGFYAAPSSASSNATTTPASAPAYPTTTTVAGELTTVYPAAKVPAAGTGGAAVAYVGSSSSNGTVPVAPAAGSAGFGGSPGGSSPTPAYSIYTGEGEMVVASGMLCFVVAFAAILL